MPRKSREPGRPSPDLLPGPVVVVGRGRVGNSLVQALFAAGVTPVPWPGRAPRAPRGETGQPVTRRPAEPDAVGLMVLCIPDDALRAAARRLSRAFAGRFQPGAAVLHVSGALGAAEIDTFRESGCHVGSWHPLQTFPELRGGRFEGIRVAVEGDPDAVEIGERLACLLGARPFALPTSLKTLYHALCTVSCSHTAALLLLCRNGLEAFPRDLRDAVWGGLLDLARTTVGNLERFPDPRRALTGPSVRGDRRTVNRHLKTLNRIDPFHRTVYELLDRCVQSFLPEAVPKGSSGMERALEMLSEKDPAAGELLRQLLRRGPAS